MRGSAAGPRQIRWNRILAFLETEIVIRGGCECRITLNTNEHEPYGSFDATFLKYSNYQKYMYILVQALAATAYLDLAYLYRAALEEKPRTQQDQDEAD